MLSTKPQVKIMESLSVNEVEKKLQHIVISGSICVYHHQRCEELTPIANKIIALKKKLNVLLLAHSYAAPEIIYLVADYVGDSYKLSTLAKNSQANNIVYAAVRFMAETGKIINPNKRFFVGNEDDGCTLADSISAKKVDELRKEYPTHTFVCYINTSAAVKARCDVCVTSSNVYDIVEKLPNKNIYFLPDELMGKNLINEMQSRNANKTIEIYSGNCYVHKTYQPEMIDFMRLKNPNLQVLVHPECAPNIVEKANFVGSTAGILNHVQNSNHSTFFVLSECGLVSRLQSETKNKTFIGSCTLCRYMKDNSLNKILELLQLLNEENKENLASNATLTNREIFLDEETIAKARQCIDTMFTLTEKTK